MPILEDNRKVLWTRDNSNNQHGKVDLIIENDTFLALRHSQSPTEILLTKDQLFEMAFDAANHFEMGLCYKPILAAPPCPSCGGRNFDYQGKTGFGVQKFCCTCGLCGPCGDDEAEADGAWDRIFNPDITPLKSITIEEELQRR